MSEQAQAFSRGVSIFKAELCRMCAANPDSRYSFFVMSELAQNFNVLFPIFNLHPTIVVRGRGMHRFAGCAEQILNCEIVFFYFQNISEPDRSMY
jgi:hypothetical protein